MDAFGWVAAGGEAVVGGGGQEQNCGEKNERHAGGVDELRAAWELAEALRKYICEEEAERGLRAGENHATFHEDVLDAVFQFF